MRQRIVVTCKQKNQAINQHQQQYSVVPQVVSGEDRVYVVLTLSCEGWEPVSADPQLKQNNSHSSFKKEIQ